MIVIVEVISKTFLHNSLNVCQIYKSSNLSIFILIYLKKTKGLNL
jgi:hypothetical protein